MNTKGYYYQSQCECDDTGCDMHNGPNERRCLDDSIGTLYVSETGDENPLELCAACAAYALTTLEIECAWELHYAYDSQENELLIRASYMDGYTCPLTLKDASEHVPNMHMGLAFEYAE